MNEDTISAIATAVGEGGIGVVRVSGKRAFSVAKRIFIAKSKRDVDEIAARCATYGTVVDPESGEVMDEALLIKMRAPNSYTCEDVVEFQCHGGPVPLKRILRLTLKEGARLAEPGEFTKRAFLNGRLDLAQAQAVMDVIRAKTDASARMALGHLRGAFSESLQQRRHTILQLISQLEAAIDFPEDDIDEIAADEVIAKARYISDEIEQLLKTASTGRILRDGLETVIIGKPNVGKSSLLNVLLKENRAIVADIPGTTRDVIEECANIDGVLLKFIDTAGIRETSDVVEQMGVEKSKSYIARADLILAVFNASEPLTAEDLRIFSLIKEREAIILANQSDLGKRADFAFAEKELEHCKIIEISTKTGAGIEVLEKTILELVYCGNLQRDEGAFIHDMRQYELLAAAKLHIDEALKAAQSGMPPDFISIDLRSAWEKIGEITGDTIDDDLVHQIFSKFCIGK